MIRLDNSELAALFAEMADLLALRGGDPHRVKAFSRAARALEHLPEPAERMLRYGTLEKVPGVGEGTIHRLKQVFRRGSCDDLDRLRSTVPAGLKQLTGIKGIGAPLARDLYHRLRITTVEELEAAARSGRLRESGRWGVDRIHALLREIDVWKSRLGKRPLAVAEGLGRRIADAMRSVPGAGRVELGGSVRRRKPLIDDLDVVVECEEPGPAVERFTRLSEVEQVLMRRDDGASIRIADHQQVDLRVVPPGRWGAGLHHFTGSKLHNVALRTRAGRLGWHLSEKGIRTRDRETWVHRCAEEADLYRVLGLPWIAPELREHTGEIEAAEEGRLPTLIEADDLRGDLHCHTTDSDGTGTAREMAEAALRLGYEYLAITDHSAGLAVAGGLDGSGVLAQLRRLRELEQRLGGLRVLAGIEVDILPDGSLDLEPEVLRQLDWVVGSVHRDLEQPREQMTARVVRALESGWVDCLGHPTGRKLGLREGASIDLDRVFDVARRVGVAVEVNGNPRRMDLDEAACRRAREMGVAIVLDTDAHSPAHLARREYALAVARRGWLEAGDVWNTRPADDVLDLRRERFRRRGMAVPARRPAPPPRPVEQAVEPAGSAVGSGATDLAERLRHVPLDVDLEERLRAWLEDPTDPELEAALADGTDRLPVQRALELLMGGGTDVASGAGEEGES